MRKPCVAVLLSCLSVALLGAGCGDDGPIEEVEQVVDCAQICERFDDCTGADIDLTACTDACEDDVEASTGVRADADACEECLDDRSCEQIETAGCFDDCPVVPLTD